MDPEARPTRRRGEPLRRAVVEAALDELAEHGYGGFSMERVAARAGTGKASLYRRWANRDELILAAVRGGVPTGADPVYTGSLREDLLTQYRGAARGLRTPVGAALRAVLSETHRRPDLLEALHDVVFDPGARGLRAMLAGAAEAGEIDPVVVDKDVVTLGHEMLMFTFMTSGHVTETHVVQVVDDVMLPVLGVRPRRDDTHGPA